MKIGDLVKRTGEGMLNDPELARSIGIIVDYDRTLAMVKWNGVAIAKWINPAFIEVISENR
jgi:hypothetical protein